MTNGSKRWAATSFAAEEPEYAEGSMAYLCFQCEICPETQRRHWQMYVEFKLRKTMAGAKKLFKDKEVHLEPARLSQEANIAYTKKSESAVEGTWKEFGTRAAAPKGEGWTELGKRLAEPLVDMAELIEHFPNIAIPHLRNIGLARAMLLGPPKMRELDNHVWWGKAGVGKTRRVIEFAGGIENVYFKVEGEWWDGYVGQKVVVCDDFYGQHRIAQILRWTDRYPMQVPIKGGFVWLRHETFIFTSNEPPDMWWRNQTIAPDVWGAIQRRIPPDRVEEMKAEEAPPEAA